MEKLRSGSVVVLLFLVLFVFTASAHAGLLNRGTDIDGNRLIYDSDLNITWYDYTPNYNSWHSQMNWADSLTVDFGGTVYDDWRLPSALNSDGSVPCGNANTCSGSEMGHLFFTELGNHDFPTAGYGLSNTGPFLDLVEYYYWTGSSVVEDEYTTWGSYFSFEFGSAHWEISNYNQFAIAVRTGDVATAVVPEPISTTLFIFGGITLFGRRYLIRRMNERGHR